MSRPRWHDVLIVSAIACLLVAGIWSLWEDEVRSALGLPAAAAPAGSGSGAGSPAIAPAAAPGST